MNLLGKQAQKLGRASSSRQDFPFAVFCLPFQQDEMCLHKFAELLSLQDVGSRLHKDPRGGSG